MKKLLIILSLFVFSSSAFAQSTLENTIGILLYDLGLTPNSFNSQSLTKVTGLKTIAVDPRLVHFLYKKIDPTSAPTSVNPYLDCSNDCNAYVIDIDGQVFAAARVSLNPGLSRIQRIVLEHMRTYAIALGVKLEFNLYPVDGKGKLSPAWGVVVDESYLPIWISNIRLSNQPVVNSSNCSKP